MTTSRQPSGANQQDFSFPDAGVAPAAPAASPPEGTSSATAPPDMSPLTQAIAPPSGLSGQDWAIAGGVLLLAAVIFFFVKNTVTNSLVKSRAAPDAAQGAGWALFAFLLALTAAAVIGLLGDFWSRLVFLAPGGLLVLATGVLALVMISKASATRR